MKKYIDLKISNINVLLLSHEFPPKLGGAGTVAKILYSFINEIDYIDISVIAGASDVESSRISVNNYYAKLWPLSYRSLLKNINEFDVIICNDSVSIYLAGKYFSDDLLKRTLCFVHGEEKLIKSNSIMARFIRFNEYYKRGVEGCSSTVFVSEYIKKFFIDTYSYIPSDPVVIYSAIESTLMPEKIRKPKNNNIKFFTASRLVKGKGFDKMLQVLACMSKISGMYVTWDVAGDGNYRDEFSREIKLIKEKYPKLTVNILGAVPRSELKEFMKESSFYILLSELKESFGLSYIEAADSGLVPIGYNLFGVKEAFDFISHGLLVEPDDSIEYLVEKIVSLTKDEVDFISVNRDSDIFVGEVIEKIKSIVT